MIYFYIRGTRLHLSEEYWIIDVLASGMMESDTECARGKNVGRDVRRSRASLVSYVMHAIALENHQ
jgi:hypothetical protein